MARGYLLLLLHAHLPYVRHPEQPACPQERWLFEAISESYLPLLGALQRLAAAGVPCRLTLSLSPTLLAMLGDPLLQRRYRAHLAALIRLAERERDRTRGTGQPRCLARFYWRWLVATRERYLGCHGGDLVRGFLELARAGVLELITTAATHGFLPLLRDSPEAVRAQLRVGLEAFTAVTGRPPAGLWLPECGYYPGLDRELAALGLGYTFLETHGLTHATPRPRHGVARPLLTEAGVACFGRDPGCSREVWSRERGYPGHPLYREFHRDPGYELPAEQLAGLGAGQPTGLKYHRVTDRRSPHKDWYHPAAARAQARLHARAFVAARVRALGTAAPGACPPLFVAPYDAELFGHWWFEGPLWLEQVVRAAAADGRLELITAGDYLARHPGLPMAAPAASSWGDGGYNGHWISPASAWLYPQLHGAARQLSALAAVPDGADPLRRRALAQAARTLLLAQASDWPFLIRDGAAADYAEGRVRDLLARLGYLLGALESGTVEPRRLAALEQLDAIFPELDGRVFAPVGG
jgi:1,4-alpha-glucan branching enzyme